MKIKLLTDYIDIYDHHFCGSYETPDFIFDRRTDIGMNRIEIFNFFFKNRINMATYGNINEFSFGGVKDVIVYLDTNSHRGENKIKMPFEKALSHYCNYFASEYIKPHMETKLGLVVPSKSTSYRQLIIGNYEFWLKYQSDHEFLSNNGNVNINIEFYSYNAEKKLVNNPIYAVDYVKDEDGVNYAIDLNLSPGLKHTGIEKYIKPREIYEEIENWYMESIDNWEL